MNNIKACVFDAYGTLFDVHSAVSKYRAQLGEPADALSQLWRTKQLEYTWLRSLMKRHADFWQVTQHALDYAFGAYAISDKSLKDRLMQAYLQLDCYPEVKQTLSALKGQGFITAILSNGSPKMLDPAVKNASLQDLLDAILSVEQVGIYKPSPIVYELATNNLSVQPKEVCFLSSNAWDVAGGACFGFMVVWINRFDQKPERLPCVAHAEINSLSELPPLLAEQRS